MPLPIAIGSLLLGGLQTGISAFQLNQLNKQPQPNFSITPELQNSYGRAESRTGYGYSPEQRADYMGNVAGRNAQVYNNAIKLSGGNLSGALGRGIQSASLRDYSTFAANDAQLQQNNIRYADQIGNQMTNQRNMATNQNIQNRVRQEQAWGGALQSGLNNIAGAANFFAMNGGFNQPGGTTPGAPTNDTTNQMSYYGNQAPQAGQFAVQPGSPFYNSYSQQGAAYGGVPAAGVQGYTTPGYNFNQNFSGLNQGFRGPWNNTPVMNPNLSNGINFAPANNWGANNSWLNPSN